MREKKKERAITFARPPHLKHTTGRKERKKKGMLSMGGKMSAAAPDLDKREGRAKKSAPKFCPEERKKKGRYRRLQHASDAGPTI